jgi:hypothetical protein
MKRTGIYYLNNTGSRWIVLDENGNKPMHTFTAKAGNTVTRTAQRYEQWGNFTLVIISYKGKQRKVFSDEVLGD